MRGILLGLWLGLALNVIQFASSTILLRSLSMSFTDLPAKFAVGINDSDICGALNVVNPLDACRSLSNDLRSTNIAVGVNDSGICGALHVVNPLDACRSLSNDLRSTNSGGINFALIIRGECAFEEKVRNAQKAGFNAAIVYDNQDKGNLVYMMVNRENISVHAVFISKRAGEILKENARGEDDECCIFPFNSETAWTVLAISFISFIVILAILIVAIFTPRRWLTSRGRNNLPRNVDVKMVEALPCFTYSSAHLSDCHAGETCAICLEDYKDGEILKVLPCRHEYHSSCVDSWLIKWGTFCPVCKHDMRTEYECSEVKRRTWL